MKKLLSVIAAGLTAITCIPFAASADNETVKLPFELSAPENVSITYLDGRDSPSTCEIHYSQNNSMSAWSSKMNDTETHDAAEAELAEMGYDDLWINAQIDWSLDSQDDWKCNDLWLTGGYDEDYVLRLGDWAYINQNYSNETSMSDWIFRYMGNMEDAEDSFWYGADEQLGWKDVLKEGQYKLVVNENGKYPWIDFSEHTAYVRVRWLVTVRPSDGSDDIPIVSDWSEIAAVGKDAEKIEPLKSGDIAPPVISDLKYMEDDFNGFPVIGFKLDVTPELAKQVAQVNGTSGVIRIYTEARVQGKGEWVELQGDLDIKSGDIQIDLQALAEAEKSVAKDTPIELRTRYWCSQNEQEDFYSAYSNVLTFGSLDMEVTTGEIVDTIGAIETTTAAAKKDSKKKCGLCGFCPHPLGICIFIWIAIILAIAGGIFAYLHMRNKKVENDGEDSGKNDKDSSGKS